MFIAAAAAILSAPRIAERSHSGRALIVDGRPAGAGGVAGSSRMDDQIDRKAL